MADNNTPSNGRPKEGYTGNTNGSGYVPAAGNGSRKNGGGSGKATIAAILTIVLFGCLLLAGLIPRLRQNRKIEAAAQAEKTDAPKILVIKPQPTSDSTLNLPGTTQAIEDAQVGARTTGYVIKRYVDIGAHVKAGQVLAEIDSPDVDQQVVQAAAQSAQSRATVVQSQADLAAKNATVAQYRANVGQAEATREQTKAQLADARARVSQLQSAEKAAEAQRDQAVQQVDVKKAALLQANTSSNLAKVTYERYKSLLDKGYVSAQDVDQHKADYENSQALVKSAQSDVTAAEKAVEGAESNISSAKANITSGEAQVNAAQKTVAAASQAVSSTQSIVSSARASAEGSKSAIEANRFAQTANQANERRYGILRSFEKVVAPFDGVITARNIDVGSLVNSGSGAASGGSSGGSTSATSSTNIGSASSATTSSNTAGAGGLFGIARTDVMRILVPVPQVYATTMRPGLMTRVTMREFPGQIFQGTVAHVSGAMDSVSRSLLTEIHLPNKDGKLLPGMFAQVSIDLPTNNSGLRVPATSVLFDSQGTRVAVVNPDNTIHYTNVKQGRDFNTQVEIVDGLSPNSVVLVSPSDDLLEGQKIVPEMSKPLPQPGAAPAGPGAAPTAQPKTSQKP